MDISNFVKYQQILDWLDISQIMLVGIEMYLECNADCLPARARFIMK